MDARAFVAPIVAAVVFVMAWVGISGGTAAAHDAQPSHGLAAQTSGHGAHTPNSVHTIGDEQTPGPSTVHDECSRAVEACCPAVCAVLPGEVRVAVPVDEGALPVLSWALPPDPWLRGIFKPPPLDS